MEISRDGNEHMNRELQERSEGGGLEVVYSRVELKGLESLPFRCRRRNPSESLVGSKKPFPARVDP